MALTINQGDGGSLVITATGRHQNVLSGMFSAAAQFAAIDPSAPEKAALWPLAISLAIQHVSEGDVEFYAEGDDGKPTDASIEEAFAAFGRQQRAA